LSRLGFVDISSSVIDFESFTFLDIFKTFSLFFLRNEDLG
jgi:hypothetical protein